MIQTAIFIACRQIRPLVVSRVLSPALLWCEVFAEKEILFAAPGAPLGGDISPLPSKSPLAMTKPHLSCQAHL